MAAAAETRNRLEAEIARLEGTIEREGGLGLVDPHFGVHSATGSAATAGEAACTRVIGTQTQDDRCAACRTP